jgi:chorismate synthase
MLAYACMGIGGEKGIEFGAGFASARMRGSAHTDQIHAGGFATNNAGGVLGGISNGDTVVMRLAVKPTSSIAKRQRTIDKSGAEADIEIKGRHDPCIAPRLLPVAEAMCCLTIYDAWLSWQETAAEGASAVGDYDWDAIDRIVDAAW